MARHVLEPGGALSELKATAGQRKLALAVSLTLLAGSAISLPFASTPWLELQPLLPGYLAVTWFADLVTAVFLLFQFRLTGSRPLLALAAAFLFVSCITIPYSLTDSPLFPYLGMPGADERASIWFWAFWHIGFPLPLLAYAVTLRSRHPLIARPSRRTGASTAIVVALTAGSVALLLWWIGVNEDGLAAAMPGYGGRSLTATGIGPTALALNALALFLLLRIAGTRSFLHLWLIVSVLASTLDIAVTLFSTTAYSIGWYIARINSVISSTVILCLFVFEMNRLYNRLVRREHELRMANEKLSVLSLVDGLTGVANRRRFDDSLANATERLRAADASPIALLLMDIDSFKSYNDRYGHVAGDDVIRRIAQTAELSVRYPDDLVARYGGEEFAVVLHDADPAAALIVADRLREAVQRLSIVHEGSEYGVVTVSIGAAFAVPGGGVHPIALLEAADAALYDAKRGGRNRTYSGDILGGA